MPPVRLLSALAVAVTALGLMVPLAVTAAAAPVVPAGLPAAAAAQIDAIAAAKHARTPSQRKVSSRLLTAAVQQAGGRVAPGVGSVATGVVVAKTGTTHVTIATTVGADPAGVAKHVISLGGRVRATWKASVDADLPLKAVSTLATSAAVRHIDPADQATLADEPPAASHASVQERVDAATATTPASAAAAPAPAAAARTVDSEGDKALGADVARAQYQVGGAGITVGVLSDGVDSLAAAVAAGELPASTRVLDGQEGAGDEGTAMLEIVHDIAPTSNLLFATALNGADSFAANIRALWAAGADIIVDDVLYYAESPFQDGPIAQAVLDVTAEGALYFSSAGNEGNVDDGTSGNWEGDFVSSGKSIGKYAGVAHDFAPGKRVQTTNPVSDDSGGNPALLFWADPLGAAADDYDLYAVDDATGEVVAFSNDTQDGNDDPFEALQIPGPGVSLAVVKYAGSDRYFQVTDFRGRFEQRGSRVGYVAPGVTRGHSAVPAAFSVGAAPAAGPLPFQVKPGLANPRGPFPGQYTSAQKSEVFTSDGPRRVFFHPDGTPVTPGNTSSTGGVVRAKPDVTSADGVSTSLADFDPFFGTSAAAPHAAATAALVLSGNPGITPAAVRTALTSGVIDIEAPGYDRDTGFGIAQAPKILARTGATSQPLVTAGAPTVTPGGDGDAFVEPGETARITVPLTNTGDGVAANVNVALVATAGTITPTLKQVGIIAKGATKTAVFTLTVPASQRQGDAIGLTVTVRFTGALSPTTATFSVPIGQPGPAKVFSYAGAPVPIPDATPAGVQVPLAVTGVGTASSLTFSIDGTVCTDATKVGIAHTFDGDLIGTLVAPDGTRVTLFSRVGSSGDNFCQTRFDDTATTSIQDVTSADAPFTGTYQPAEPLSTFTGTNADGTWHFVVSDNAALDTGTVRAFSLRVAGYVAG